MKRRFLTALGWLLLASVVSAILDTNRNGLSDPWERTHNNDELFAASFNPQADEDSDGWTNAQEAAAGTDPFDPSPPDGLVRPETAHTPAVYGEPDGNGIPELETPEAVTVTWPTLVGKRYTLLFSPDLSAESWLPVGAPYIGNGNDFVYTFPTSDTDSRFWRVAVTDLDADGDGLTNHEEFLLGSNPHAADTSGDGVPDFWLAAHGMTVAADHSGSLFPGFALTVPEAFRSGVQAWPTATPDDLDGDGVSNLVDADPRDITVLWRRTCTPVWALRSTELSTDHQVLDLSPAGSMLFLSLSPTIQLELLRLPDLQIRNIPDAPPGDANGFFHHPLSGVLHGERVFGQRVLDSNNPPSTEWAYFDPVAATVTGAGVPQNNPPEMIWDATGTHVSAVGGGFPALFGGHQGYFESDESAVALDHQNNMLRYWTFAAGTYDAGRAVTGVETNDFPGNRSATLRQTISGQSEVVYHLVPTRKGLFAAEGGGTFFLTGVFDSSGTAYWKTWATRQGWLIDETLRLWSNGAWGDVEPRLPRRASDGALPEIQQIHKARDTGFVLATTRYPGGTWKHALLMPVQLQVRFPASGLTIPWEDYLPGYEGTVPKLCPAGRSAFEGSHVRTAQAVELVFSGPTVEEADSVQVSIEQVSNLAGWSGNDGDDDEADFSFAAESDTTSASAAVQAGHAAVTIHCKDYAAWTALHVTLLKNNQPIHDQPVTVTLPLDTNGDRIADAWQMEEVRRWNTQYRLDPDDPGWVNPNDAATWTAVFGTDGSEDAEPADSDGVAGPMPAMADDGDGLKAIEEYRGFFLDGGPGITQGRHKRLSIASKEMPVEASVEAGLTTAAKNGPNTNLPALTAFTVPAAMADVSAFYRDPNKGAAIDLYWVEDPIIQPGPTIHYQDNAFPTKGAREWIGEVQYLRLAGGVNIPVPVTAAGVPLIDRAWRSFDTYEHDRFYKGVPPGDPHAKLQTENRNPHLEHFVKLLLPTRIGYLMGGVHPIPGGEEIDVSVPRYLGESGDSHSIGEASGARVPVATVADEGIGYYYEELHRHFTPDEFNRLIRRDMAHELGHLIHNNHSGTANGDAIMDDTSFVLPNGMVRGLSTARWHDLEIQQITLPGKSSGTPAP